MVSFWPFRSDETSAASFEKTLSQLSQKINQASSRNDNLRQRQRRYKVLWTLYTSFAYILVALILTLVTGWQTWGSAEYSAMAGGPVVIFAVRTAMDAYFNYRIANAQNQLNSLVKQREATIQKLKTATKYDSTQQLLDKYGGTPQKRKPSPQPSKRKSGGGGPSNQSTPQGRTGFVPPPTANIPGRTPPRPATPQSAPRLGPPQPFPGGVAGPSEEFAPNAFTAPPPPGLQPAATEYATAGPKWYDRILDVVLGEDESQAKNRVVLICKHCRLVNGQAPPGTRSLEEVGKWRCSACHAWNGVESEERKILKGISGTAASPPSPDTSLASPTDASTKEIELSDYEEVDEHFPEDEERAEAEAADKSPASSTRSKSAGTK